METKHISGRKQWCLYSLRDCSLLRARRIYQENIPGEISGLVRVCLLICDMLHGPPPRYAVLTLLFVLAIVSGSQGSWVQNLIDPSLSLWNPVTASSSLAITNVGFDNAQGYAVSFGDFDSDS